MKLDTNDDSSVFENRVGALLNHLDGFSHAQDAYNILESILDLSAAMHELNTYYAFAVRHHFLLDTGAPNRFAALIDFNKPVGNRSSRSPCFLTLNIFALLLIMYIHCKPHV